MATQSERQSERRPNRMNRDAKFWRDDFIEIHGKLLLKHNGRMGPTGTAQLAGEHADAAVAEFRRRRFK